MNTLSTLPAEFRSTLAALDTLSETDPADGVPSFEHDLRGINPITLQKTAQPLYTFLSHAETWRDSKRFLEWKRDQIFPREATDRLDLSIAYYIASEKHLSLLAAQQWIRTPIAVQQTVGFSDSLGASYQEGVVCPDTIAWALTLLHSVFNPDIARPDGRSIQRPNKCYPSAREPRSSTEALLAFGTSALRPPTLTFDDVTSATQAVFSALTGASEEMFIANREVGAWYRLALNTAQASGYATLADWTLAQAKALSLSPDVMAARDHHVRTVEISLNNIGFVGNYYNRTKGEINFTAYENGVGKLLGKINSAFSGDPLQTVIFKFGQVNPVFSLPAVEDALPYITSQTLDDLDARYVLDMSGDQIALRRRFKPWDKRPKPSTFLADKHCNVAVLAALLAKHQVRRNLFYTQTDLRKIAGQLEDLNQADRRAIAAFNTQSYTAESHVHARFINPNPEITAFFSRYFFQSVILDNEGVHFSPFGYCLYDLMKVRLMLQAAEDPRDTRVLQEKFRHSPLAKRLESDYRFSRFMAEDYLATGDWTAIQEHLARLIAAKYLPIFAPNPAMGGIHELASTQTPQGTGAIVQRPNPSTSSMLYMPEVLR